MSIVSKISMCVLVALALASGVSAESVDDVARLKLLEDRIAALERELGVGKPCTPLSCAGFENRGEGEIPIISPNVIAYQRQDKIRFMRSLRAVPQSDTRNGPGMGLRLLGIRPGSFLHCLGIVNGDIVVAVDGQPIQDVIGFAERILRAEIDSGGIVTITGTRAHQPLEVRFAVKQ